MNQPDTNNEVARLRNQRNELLLEMKAALGEAARLRELLNRAIEIANNLEICQHWRNGQGARWMKALRQLAELKDELAALAHAPEEVDQFRNTTKMVPDLEPCPFCDEVAMLRERLETAEELIRGLHDGWKKARKAHLETCKNAQAQIDKLHTENVCLQELIQEFYEWSRRDFPTEAEVREIMDRYHNLLNK